MAKHLVVKAVGMGLVAGGMLLGAQGMASADALTDAVGAAVDGANGAVQNVVDQNNQGAQGITAINNGGLQSNTALNNSGLQSGVANLNDAAQASVPAGQSVLTAANGLVKFAVQGLFKK